MSNSQWKRKKINFVDLLHRSDAGPDPDPAFHFDADPDLDSDSDPDPTPSFTQVGKSGEKIIHSSASLHFFSLASEVS
jgi:hypothetical protein